MNSCIEEKFKTAILDLIELNLSSIAMENVIVKKSIRAVLAAGLLFSTEAIFAEDPLRYFDVYEVPEAGLVVYSPGNPVWEIDVTGGRKDGRIFMSTPELYYPPTTVEIFLNQKYTITESELAGVARSVATVLRQKVDADEELDGQLASISYGDIVAVKDDFATEYEGESYSIRHVIGMMPSGRVIRMVATSSTDQLDSVEFMLSKIYTNLREI